MIATGGTVGLPEGIIDDTHVFFLFVFPFVDGEESVDDEEVDFSQSSPQSFTMGDQVSSSNRIRFGGGMRLRDRGMATTNGTPKSPTPERFSSRKPSSSVRSTSHYMGGNAASKSPMSPQLRALANNREFGSLGMFPIEHMRRLI